MAARERKDAVKRRILMLIVLALGIVSILCIPAAQAAVASSYMYFESYDVNIVVQENNVLNVTETIVADYDVVGELRHGILREIPTQLDFTFPDGSQRRFHIVLSDIEVIGHPYTVSTDGAYRVLQIGDPDTYATGLVTYTIQYKYDLGDDFYEKGDFFYYNIIGTEWYADINSVSFRVEMPKAFNADAVEAYAGAYGYTNRVNINVEGNVITGTASDLGIYEGVTVLVDLPEGYFVGERTGPPFVPMLLIAFGAIAALSIVLFFIFGRDEKVVQTVEFTAPEGMTPAEIGYIIDGSVDNKDVTSLIIYWADKGYLAITELEKDDIQLTKLRDLPQNAKSFEKTMFNALFKSGDEVSVSSLKNTFFTTMETMKVSVKKSFGGTKRIFTKTSISMQGLVGFLTALPIALSVFFTIQYDSSEFFASIMLSVIALALIISPVYVLINLVKAWRALELGKRIGRMILSLVLLSVVFTAYLAFMGLVFDLWVLAIASVAATLVTALCAMFIRKRTKRGTRLMGQTLGLRNFIDKAEKERILTLVEENPNYFYSVLPYAYVLGVTDKWAKNFERIGVQPPPPSWYTGYAPGNLFTTMLFINMFNNSMRSINSSFVSRPAPQGGTRGGFGGGGFGGGGFSGGGFGGGGGGGW